LYFSDRRTRVRTSDGRRDTKYKSLKNEERRQKEKNIFGAKGRSDGEYYTKCIRGGEMWKVLHVWG